MSTLRFWGFPVRDDYTDSRSGTITLSGSSTEFKAYTDSSSGTISLSGSKTESRSANDSAAGTLSSSGAASESLSHSSTASGAITLSGSSSESYQVAGNFFDSATGTITLDGTATESFVPPTPSVTGGAGGFAVPLRPRRPAPPRIYSDTAYGRIHLLGSAEEDWERLPLPTERQKRELLALI